MSSQSSRLNIKRTCNVCQDLDPLRQASNTLEETQTSAAQGCQGCIVLSAVLAPYWEHYKLDDDCGWSFADMKRTLSIEIFRPLERKMTPSTSTTEEKSLGFYNSGMYGLLRGSINMALWDLGRLPMVQKIKALSKRGTTKSAGPASQVHARDLLGSLWSENEPVTNIELWTLTDKCPWQRLALTTAVSRDTGSDEAFVTLGRWIDHCVASHVSCNQLMRSQKLPNRVVEYLGPQSIRLRETHNESGRYVCLSHCWGMRHFVCTLKGNYHKHCDSIPWDYLPLTFIHAIEIAHRLGIDYIWIDSLCIVQDDRDDWSMEAATMCDVYTNAYLTIAATKSSSGEGGCFSVTDARSGRNHSFLNTPHDSYTLHVREPLPHINDFDKLDDELACFPLLARAWVFQERSLSARVVHFGPKELLWECMATRTCECTAWPEYTDGVQTMVFDKPYMMLEKIPPGYTGTALTTLEEWQWRRVVEQFTAKRLTQNSDRLIALAGVAKFLQRDGDYLAGLWDDDGLIGDLLWHVRAKDPDQIVRPTDTTPWKFLGQRSNSQEPIAPSWSWASISNPVAFTIQFDAPVRALAYIEDVKITGTQARMLGQLILRGQCIEALLVPDTGNPVFPALEIEGKIRFGAPRLNWNAGTVDGLYPDYDITYLYGRTVVIMEILRWREGRSRTAYSSCLVFRSTTDKDQVTYERIGYVDTRKQGDMAYFAQHGVETTLVVV